MAVVFYRVASLPPFLGCGTHLAKGGGGWIHFVVFASLRILLCTVRAGDEGRISGVIPDMGQVMSLCASIHGYGTCDVCAAVMFSFITSCAGRVRSLL